MKMLVTVTGLQKVTKVIRVEDEKKLESITKFDEIEKYLYEVSPEVKEFYKVLEIGYTSPNTEE